MTKATSSASVRTIRIRGAHQNNLKNLNVDFEQGKFTVVTGVSGSGKSSLVFDTLYAEGQRRYVETFSPYVRQFMDRMDRPDVESVEGVPPAIAIDQTNPVRTSRSTVGTMTEINDYLKMLFSQAASLYCRQCGSKVQPDSPESIWASLCERFKAARPEARISVAFRVHVPAALPLETAMGGLEAQGFTRVSVLSRSKTEGAELEVIVDRFKPNVDKSRAVEAIETSLRLGKGLVRVYIAEPDSEPETLAYSSTLSCPQCNISYSLPHGSTFSFNSPLGACEECKGFGRVIGVDFGLVVPDETKSLARGAVKPWTTPSYAECQDDLLRYARRKGIDCDIPFKDLTQEEKDWVFYGESEWKNFKSDAWYGVCRFFDWLETKAYKMHVRVLLSRYRSYTTCHSCHGSRLKPDALLWRIGTYEDAARALGKAADDSSDNKAAPQYKRFRPIGATFSEAVLEQLPGLCLFDLQQLPIERLKAFFDRLTLPSALAEGCEMLLKELRARLLYLTEVGLGYLTLDRQSRTLSGGEVQRINLTTALGTSLVNTLFVLDEPSIGLHPKDMDRINSVIGRLKEAGNSLVVVEHDPQVMLSADRILDMGPGPGAGGGRIVFDGTPEELRSAKTLTGAYLRGEKTMPHSKNKRINPANPALVLLGAAEHNLKNIDIRIPLHALVCVAGVSGSGKSTLVQDILVPALLKAKGKPTEAPGKFEELQGAEHIEAIEFVDQTPIGKTGRSTPAVFIGAFDVIRKLFAFLPASREKNYSAADFSFNGGGQGRCPVCEGSGSEHIEMQFLSDVYLKCHACGGSRYKDEILKIKIRRKGKELNIAEVLDLTVEEALDFFSDNAELERALSPLVKVGLGYVRLGQPVPTLSGGEAQRLKLASHLAQAAKGESKHTLFVFDEPTTGLHFDDVAKLMAALQELVQSGHSVLLVEHNLDVINASDWIIELGPEGGEKGGRELFAGTPKDFEIRDTPTGLALRSYNEAIKNKTAVEFFTDFRPETTACGALEEASRKSDCISVINAREHNLRNISLKIPRDKFTVITGVSGSGKSTLAFDLIFNEGQRRYLESLNAYARSMVQPAQAPDVDAIYGIPPTVAIEQRTSRGGRKSTVATVTEIYHFLRLLFVKLGTQFCPSCHVPVVGQSPEIILASILKEFRGRSVMLSAPLVKNRKGMHQDIASSVREKGYRELIVDGERISTSRFPRLDRYKDHTIELPVKTLIVGPETEKALREALSIALEFGKGFISILAEPVPGELGAEKKDYSTLYSCPSCQRSFHELEPRSFSYNSALGWCPACGGNGVISAALLNAPAASQTEEITDKEDERYILCADCSGTRLNEAARNVLYLGRSIADIAGMTVEDSLEFFNSLKLEGRDEAIGGPLVKEILSRLHFLKEVGLSYLTLDRSAPTLSGGEAQRIRLASQLGTNLEGVCYVLDEPSIGLHPRDNKRLLSSLEKLAAKGNTLLVVEHDDETIRRADHIIDIGPGAGTRGGTVVAQGAVEDIERSEESVTGRYLRSPLSHSFKARRRTLLKDEAITLSGVSMHNLKDVTVRFPLERLTVLTGVSGSGKSTLVRGVLEENLSRKISPAGKAVLSGCRDLSGYEGVARVLEVDQTPIGKTPRSCPATYIGFWDNIRKLFAASEESKARGYSPTRFSFNSAQGGRCGACAGQGQITLEMNFLPDVKVECDTCSGMRFNDETLQVKWKGKNIGEVLQMEVDEAAEFFSSVPAIHYPLKMMQDVGLGYLTLGQPSPTLSGGEAQRIKLVTELVKAREDVRRPTSKSKKTVYILDEPTVGLHMADVDRLIQVLHRLVDAGNTVIVIEHNLDVIAEADWIIDMGPEGGKEGGQVVFAGAPQKLLKAQTHTARALRELKELTEQKGKAAKA